MGVFMSKYEYYEHASFPSSKVYTPIPDDVPALEMIIEDDTRVWRTSGWYRNRLDSYVQYYKNADWYPWMRIYE